MVEEANKDGQNLSTEVSKDPIHIRLLKEGFPGVPVREGSSEYIPGEGVVNHPAYIEFRGQNHEVILDDNGDPLIITIQQVKEAKPQIEKMLDDDFDFEMAGRLTTLEDIFEIGEPE